MHFSTDTVSAAFFVPIAESAEQAESVLAATAEFTKFPIPSPRIFALHYSHAGKDMVAQVGGEIDPYYQTAGPVLVILHRPGLFAVCTANRGVVRGEPILVGEPSVRRAVYFQ